MTAALNSQQTTDNEASSPLAARLDLLVRRTINVDQFEADMVRYCEANPEEVWNLLALLDQYHRLEKLPTELFRSLKASADRYGLVRREPYIPDLSPPNPAPVALPPDAIAPLLASSPAVPAAALAPTPTLQATPAPAPGSAPFRHLLETAAAGRGQNTLSVAKDEWQTGRFVRPEPPPPKRSWLRLLLLMIILAGVIAVAAVLGLLPNLATLTSSLNQVRDAVSGTPLPPEPARAAEPAPPPAAAPTAAAAAPQVAPAPTPPPMPAPAAQAPAQAPAPSSIDLSADHYTVPPGDSAARILVRRSGNLRGEVDFVWWTEAASARADVDYIAWGHRTERIPAGHNSVTLLVPIINDATRTAPRSFRVVIDAAGNGAGLGVTTRATVQLPGKG